MLRFWWRSSGPCGCYNSVDGGKIKKPVWVLSLFSFCFYGPCAFVGHDMSAVLGMWLLFLCGVTVIPLPDECQVSFEFL